MDGKVKQIIKKVTLGHCARGSKICKKCEEAEKEGKKYCLLDLFSDSEIARPMTKIKNEWFAYDAVKVFESKNNALEYSKKNNLELIDEKSA